MAKLQILYLDATIVAVDKPSGMPTHPGRGCRDRLSLLQAVRNDIGQWVYPVHRLDAGASGVVLFARSPEIAGVLGTAFAERRVHKTYRALVRGWLHGEGVIRRPLTRVDRTGEQDAESHFQALAQWNAPWPVRPYATSRYSVVEMVPVTGRTHQLRRHLAGLAHPIIGDTRYGDGAHNAAFREHENVRRLLLHAVSLELAHPTSGQPLRIDAPLPPFLEDTLPCGTSKWQSDALNLLHSNQSLGLGRFIEKNL